MASVLAGRRQLAWSGGGVVTGRLPRSTSSWWDAVVGRLRRAVLVADVKDPIRAGIIPVLAETVNDAGVCRRVHTGLLRVGILDWHGDD